MERGIIKIVGPLSLPFQSSAMKHDLRMLYPGCTIEDLVFIEIHDVNC